MPEPRLNVTATDTALKLVAELDAIRQAAGDEQLKVIEEAHRKLGILGYAESGDTPKKPKEKGPCSRCGSTQHDARYHRGEKKEATS